MPLNPKVTLSVRPVLKRAGVPVEDSMPWAELMAESFGPLDEWEGFSFDALDRDSEVWGEGLQEWLDEHPDEPCDLPLDGVLLPQRGMVHRAGLRPAPQLRRLAVL